MKISNLATFNIIQGTSLHCAVVQSFGAAQTLKVQLYLR